MLSESTRIRHRGAGVFLACSAFAVVAWFCMFCSAQPARAGIASSGDVDPADPTAWTSRTTARIGKTGSGTLNITGGGAVSNACCSIGYEPGSAGEVMVHGAGSTWNSACLSIGQYGTGTLNITGGGAVSNSGCYIGYGPGSTGAAAVDGANSTWTNSHDLHVGSQGSGTLNITNGGAVSSVFGYIGLESASTGAATVDGTGSTWANRYTLYVGGNGSGTLTITGGGAVSSSNGRIGYHSGSTGEVTVDGAGSRWTVDNVLYVGNWGPGTVNITGGGVVSSSYGYIGFLSGSTGKVVVGGAGSTWTNSHDLRVGGYGSGALTITHGGLVSVAGTLAIDYESDGDGSINMATGGMLALYGQADNLLADFLQLIDDTDTIRYWDDSISNWADITGATCGRDYTLTYLTEGDLVGYSLLTVFPGPAPLLGDANRDGTVAVADLSAMADNYGLGSGATWEQGDFNGDGAVGIPDLMALADNYGRTAAGGAVPECTTLSLLALSGLALIRRRHAVN